MTSISNTLSQAVETAVSRGGGTLAQVDVDKILSELSQGLGQDMVTLAEVRTIDSTLQRLVSAGKLSPQQAQAHGGQIRDAIDRAVVNQTMKASAMAASWLQFAGQAEGTDQAIRQMAQQAALSGKIFGRLAMSSQEIEGMLKHAAQDGKVTLSEINAMYQGINDSFKSGKISAKDRDSLTGTLEKGLKDKVGERRGMCARRVKGPYHTMLTPEAKDFVSTHLGGQSQLGGRKGWTQWKFNEPSKVQSYVKAITQDGVVSAAERQALVNSLLRSGKVTGEELQAARHALASAAHQGHITHDEYQKTLKYFDMEIAPYTGGQRADSYADQAQLQSAGMYMIRA